MRQVRTVDAAAHADNAIEVTTGTRTPDSFNYGVERFSPASIGMPIWLGMTDKVVAMIASASFIENDARVGGVHDTSAAD